MISEEESSLNNTFTRHLNEAEIKTLVLNRLLKKRKIRKEAIIANEFVIHRSKVRADLAILDKSFIGIEIKSALDGLRRIDKQIPVYCSVFDVVILVLADKHIKALKYDQFPQVEVWQLTPSNKIIEVQKPAYPNVRQRHEHVRYMSQRDILKVSESASSRIDETVYRRVFHASFKQKYRETSIAFWDLVTNGNVTSEHMHQLSLYKERRRELSCWARSRQLQWDHWLEALTKASQV